VSARILIVDDDRELAQMLDDYLSQAGFRCARSADLRSAREALSRRAPEVDLIVLDLMLPDGDGLDFCRALRAGAVAAGAAALPVLMLSARGDEADRVVGLELGADDYLAKPFGPRELLARVRALLRRPARDPAAPLRRFGRLELDLGRRVARVDGEERALTAHQFDLLCALADQPGRVMSRDALMQRLRGHELLAFDRSIDVHISRIRAAIEDDPAHPRRILTVRGSGYVFASHQDTESGLRR